MRLANAERQVCDAIAARRDEVVELATALIAFDTTARRPGDPPRDEAALQEYLARRLRATGALVEVFEPGLEALSGRPLVPPGLDDGATLTQLGGIPSVGYGPPGFDRHGVSMAHAVDEHVPVDGLLKCAQALAAALAAMRFCGTAG